MAVGLTQPVALLAAITGRRVGVVGCRVAETEASAPFVLDPFYTISGCLVHRHVPEVLHID